MRLHHHMNGAGLAEIHKAGCRDLDASALQNGHEFDAETKEAVVRYIWEGQLQEHLDDYGNEDYETFADATIFKPCTGFKN